MLSTSKQKTNRTSLLLALILLWGAALRLYGLAGESAWGDEVYTLALMDSTSLREFLARSFSYDPMARMIPSYAVIIFLWSQVFSEGLVALRLFSVLLGVLSIYLLFRVAKRFLNPSAALASAFFFSCSLVNVYYAQEVRFYALLSFLVILSMWALLEALEKNRTRWWLLHGAANALMLWTHAFAPLFFLMQAVYLMVWRRQPRRLARWACFHAAVVALFGLWLFLLGFHPDSESLAYNIMPATWREVVNAVVVLCGGRVDRVDPQAYMPGGVSLDLLMTASVLCAGMLLLWNHFSTAKKERDSMLALLALWFFLPLLLLLVLSYTWKMVFYYRYALYCSFVPPLVLAAGIGAIKRARLRRAVLALACAVFAYQAALMPRPLRPDYQALAREVSAFPEAEAHVHVLKPFNFQGVQYALQEQHGRAVLFTGYREICAESIARAREGNTVWAVFHRWEGFGEFEAALTDSGLTWRKKPMGGMPPLMVYRISPTP